MIHFLIPCPRHVCHIHTCRRLDIVSYPASMRPYRRCFGAATQEGLSPSLLRPSISFEKSSLNPQHRPSPAITVLSRSINRARTCTVCCLYSIGETFLLRRDFITNVEFCCCLWFFAQLLTGVLTSCFKDCWMLWTGEAVSYREALKYGTTT